MRKCRCSFTTKRQFIAYKRAWKKTRAMEQRKKELVNLSNPAVKEQSKLYGKGETDFSSQRERG